MKEIIVIKIGDYFLTGRFENAIRDDLKLSDCLTNNPANAYHWNSVDLAKNCAQEVIEILIQNGRPQINVSVQRYAISEAP